MLSIGFLRNSRYLVAALIAVLFITVAAGQVATSGDWMIETVDEDGGDCCPLAINPFGNPDIAYCCTGALGLMHVLYDDPWAPTFTNTPVNGKETVAYEYPPTFNETVTIVAHSTNAPFLTWNGTAYVGTPNTTESGTYWINISATSVAGSLTAYQNSTFAFEDAWAPTFTNTPVNGKETVAYEYEPTFNETIVFAGHSTNALFLTWNGTAYAGTPNTTESGTYWINISAISRDGLLTAYQNSTFAIEDAWAPTFTNTPGDGRETVAYDYEPTFNETVTVTAYSTNALFLTWNGSAYVGTPNTTQAGTYWINISATSTAGLLTAYQNSTFTVDQAWEPTFTTTPSEYGRETIQYTYEPGCNETVTWTVNTNAPFLSWNGTAYTGIPNTTQAGTYWVNVTATSVNGLLSVWQNYTLLINDTWTPTFTNVPGDGKETVAYAYEPTFNETVTVTAYSTNALFLTWNGTAYTGIPNTTQAGTYWINISATSVAGLLTSYQNSTFAVNDSWAPTFTNTPDNGKETVAYAYEPTFNETVTLTAHSTNAPFLSWNGSAYIGTPNTTEAGTYWINISATSDLGLLTAYQNATFTVDQAWAPTFTNTPGDGQETVAYEYQSTFNETVTIDVYETNAPFLTWNGSAYVGTPDITQAGTYWINISATSVAGLLTSYQNASFTIGETWAPTFTNTPGDGQETVAYAYQPTFNETVTLTTHSTNAPFLSWNGAAYVGTPNKTQAGTYWINISATSTAGLLAAYQNGTFTVDQAWTPTFESVPPDGPFFSTLEYEYQVGMNESCSYALETNATFLSISGGLLSGTMVAGNYSVHIGATSDLGLLTEWQNYTLVVKDDHDLPVVNISAPEDGAYLNHTTVQVEWTGYDGNGSGIIGFWLRIDDGDWEVMNMSTNATLEFVQGTHSIAVKAMDEVGNEGNDSVEIHISTSIPTVESATPTGDDVPLSAQLRITFSKEMNHDSVVVTVNGSEIAILWAVETVTYSPAGGWAEDSAYAVTVDGMDIYGNHMQRYSWQFNTEILPVLVGGTVVDDRGNPVDNASLIIGSTEVTVTDENGHFSFEVMPGTYTLTASKDGYKNCTQDVTVDKDTPVYLDIELEPEYEMWPGLLIVGIFAAFILIMLAANRKWRG